MAEVTDLFLRSQPKASVTDLWLHPAGPISGAIPPIFQSGTVTSTSTLSGVEALRDEGTVQTVSTYETVEALRDAGLAVTVATLSGDETLITQPREEGTVLSVALLSGVEALRDEGTVVSVAVHSRPPGSGDMEGIAPDAAEIEAAISDHIDALAEAAGETDGAAASMLRGSVVATGLAGTVGHHLTTIVVLGKVEGDLARRPIGSVDAGSVDADTEERIESERVVGALSGSVS